MPRHWLIAALFLLLSFGAFVPPAAAQDTNSDYDAERKKAMELFNQNNCVPALPLFEDLAKKNEQDDKVLLGLATCLLSHAATLENEDAAAQERIRARKLLLRARDMGNKDTLLKNLLEMVPEDGRIPYSKSEEDQAMRKAEAAFARNDFDEAIKNYARALELNPKNYSAALYIGDSYFAAKNWDKAGEWYGRAIQIDPDRETAYRYYADMLTKNGDMEKARRLAIQAVVADPYNNIPWRGLNQWARANQLSLKVIQITVPKNSVSQDKDNHINITMDPSQSTDVSAVWLAYSLSRAKWRGDDFKKHFPQEKEYRHSLAEESEALSTAAAVCGELDQSSEKKGKKAAPLTDENLLMLLRIYQAKMIEPYILLNAPDEGIAQDYPGYRGKNRDKLEAFLSDFVVPPAPKR